MSTPTFHRNQSNIYDVVVIGLGAHGSATLYHLAKSGLKVLGLERFELAHTMGSSHGDTRITRKVVFEDPVYVDLVSSSYDSFQELAKISNRPIFKQTGGIFMGKSDSELVKVCLSVAKAKNVPIQILNAQEIRKLNPQFDLIDKEVIGVYDKQAGVLFPENCILSFVEQASKRYGAHVETGTKYISHNKKDDHYEVKTDVGNFKAKKIVLACGMWNTEFMNQLPLEIRKIQLFWFRVPSNIQVGLDDCPIFMYEVDRNPLYYVYGFPNYKGQGIKVGFSPNQYNSVMQSTNSLIRAVDSSEKDRMKIIMAKFLPNIAKEPIIDQKECFVTMAPDEHFIIDFLPEDKNILFLSPCSAHGFKYCAGVGKLAAQMINTGERDHNYKEFNISRFNGGKKSFWSDKFIASSKENPFQKKVLSKSPLEVVPKL